MNNTEQMAEAAWQLKMLTASDPQATTNMMRHAVALALLLCGRRQAESRSGEPEVGACFTPCAAERAFLAKVTAQTGVDQVLIAFDVDDACGPHDRIVFVRHDGDGVATYETCRLWSAAGAGRAVLVPTGTQDYGHFSFRRQAALRHVAGLPAADLQAGFRRADARLAALLRSPEVRSAGRDGWTHVLSSNGGVVTTQPSRIQA